MATEKEMLDDVKKKLNSFAKYSMLGLILVIVLILVLLSLTIVTMTAGGAGGGETATDGPTSSGTSSNVSVNEESRKLLLQDACMTNLLPNVVTYEFEFNGCTTTGGSVDPGKSTCDYKGACLVNKVKANYF